MIHRSLGAFAAAVLIGAAPALAETKIPFALDWKFEPPISSPSTRGFTRMRASMSK